MYQITERPLTAAETTTLEKRLHDAVEATWEHGLLVVLLGLFDIGFAVAVVMMLAGHDLSGPLGIILGVTAGVVANVALLLFYISARGAGAEASRTREALADGFARVERVHARAFARVEANGQWWLLSDVGGGRLFAEPESLIDIFQELCAGFELINTRVHGLPLDRIDRGVSTLPIAESDSLPPDALKRFLTSPEPLVADSPGPVPVRWLLEERFGVPLPDAVPPESLPGHDRRPPVAATFYAFRRALMAEGIGRAAIRPSATLGELIPHRNRLAVWKRLTSTFGDALDRLADHRPKPTMWFIALPGIGLVYTIGVPLVQAIDRWSVRAGVDEWFLFRALGCCLVPAAFIAAMAACVALGIAVTGVRLTVKGTVGDAVRAIAEASPVLVPWTEETIAAAAREVTARHRRGATARRCRSTRLAPAAEGPLDSF
jgi:hypothetical protein